MNPLAKKIGLCALAVTALTVAIVSFSPPKVEAQTNLITSGQDKTVGNFRFKSVTISPDYIQNPSNSFFCLDNTQTNFLAISPTNNQFIVTAGGSNSFAVLSTNIVVTNTAGQTHTIIVRNGLIVNYF